MDNQKQTIPSTMYAPPEYFGACVLLVNFAKEVHEALAFAAVLSLQARRLDISPGVTLRVVASVATNHPQLASQVINPFQVLDIVTHNGVIYIEVSAAAPHFSYAPETGFRDRTAHRFLFLSMQCWHHNHDDNEYTFNYLEYNCTNVFHLTALLHYFSRVDAAAALDALAWNNRASSSVTGATNSSGSTNSNGTSVNSNSVVGTNLLIAGDAPTRAVCNMVWGCVMMASKDVLLHWENAMALFYSYGVLKERVLNSSQ